MPRRRIHLVHARDPGFPKVLFKHNWVVSRLLGKRRNKLRSMSDHNNLRTFRCSRD